MNEIEKKDKMIKDLKNMLEKLKKKGGAAKPVAGGAHAGGMAEVEEEVEL